MSHIRRGNQLLKSPSQLERAGRLNGMQTRSYTNQIEVLENNIRKKLKVIENEKLQVSRYLKFLKTSSGTSPFSVVPKCKSETPRVRPATAAGIQRMKFGYNGNANYNYMTSDAAFGWGQCDDVNSAKSDARVRIRKIEEPLQKRVSWIDGGHGGDDGIRGYSSGIRAYSAKGSLTRPATTSTATQYDPDYTVPDFVINDDIVTSQPVPRRTQSARKAREFKAIQPINITFPFPVTPDRYRDDQTAFFQSEESGNKFVTHDRRRGLVASVTSQSSRRRRK